MSGLPGYLPLLSAYHAAQRETIREAIAQLPLRPGDKVLDVPCGDGFYAHLLAEPPFGRTTNCIRRWFPGRPNWKSHCMKPNDLRRRKSGVPSMPSSQADLSGDICTPRDSPTLCVELMQPTINIH
jgi:hypothetical protein